MKKRLICSLILGIVIWIMPVLAAGDGYICETYEEFVDQINDGASTIYLQPAVSFGWPSGDVELTTNATVIVNGSLTIPENVSLWAGGVEHYSYDDPSKKLTVQGI